MLEHDEPALAGDGQELLDQLRHLARQVAGR